MCALLKLVDTSVRATGHLTGLLGIFISDDGKDKPLTNLSNFVHGLSLPYGTYKTIKAG